MRQLESENAAQVDTLKQELANARAELAQKARRAEALEVEEEVGNRKKLRAVEKDKEELRLKVVSSLRLECFLKLVHCAQKLAQIEHVTK